MGACGYITRWTQPPDAENRMSGGVGGLTGAIPLARPDQDFAENGTMNLFSPVEQYATQYVYTFKLYRKNEKWRTCYCTACFTRKLFH